MLPFYRDINLFAQIQIASQGMDETEPMSASVIPPISLMAGLFFSGYRPSPLFLTPIALLGLMPTSTSALATCSVLQAPLISWVLLSSDQVTSDSSLVT